jgi:hypothetical protein
MIKKFNEFGACLIDIDEVAKKWNHLFLITQWHDEFYLIKFLRKDSQIKEINIQISRDQALELIKKINIKKIDSSTFNFASTWVNS